MAKIYHAANLFDATEVRDLLAANGIDSRIEGGFLSGAVGELPPGDLIAVSLVNDADQQVARRLIDARRYEQSRQGDDWFCRRCREANPVSFELCWQCQSPRD